MESENAFFVDGVDDVDTLLFEFAGAVSGEIVFPPDVNLRTPVTA